MIRYLCVVFLAVFIAGCGSLTKNIVTEQEWSDNFARVKGVVATSPLMVDGDPSTMGETQPSADVSTAGATRLTDAVVKLPEAKSIRKIIVSSPNIQSMIVYAGGKNENDWKTLKEIKNNSESKITMSVSAMTDRVRVRVLRTSDDTTQPGGRGSQARLKHAPGKIKEIEIYGLVPKSQPAPPAGSAVAPAGSAPAGTVPAGMTTASAPAASVAPVAPPVEPVTASLEMAQNTYSLAVPIPLKVNLKIGPDELVVLADHVSDAMLRTKLLVKSATGETINCSKPTPPLSSPRPYRSVDKPVDVRDAKTLDPGSVVAVDVPNLLEYYPIKAPGKYIVQFSMFLEINDKFVGREQTMKDDIESQIRDINSKANYTPQEKAALIQELKDTMKQSEKTKSKRYIAVGMRGKPFELKSNVLELNIQ